MSNWTVPLWAGAISAGLMFGVATLGGAALDWWERTRGPVVVVLDSKAVAVGPDVVVPHHRAHAFRLSEICPHEAAHCLAHRLNGTREAAEF